MAPRRVWEGGEPSRGNMAVLKSTLRPPVYQEQASRGSLRHPMLRRGRHVRRQSESELEY
jgi:hypothetical protein